MIQIQFADGGLSVNLANASASVSLATQRALRDVQIKLQNTLARNLTSGEMIGRRTGGLANAVRGIQEGVVPIPNGFMVRVWISDSVIPYGDIQDEGGTVIPKTAQALTIPLEAMLSDNGAARGTAAQVRDNPRGPWGGLSFVSTFIPKGHSVIMGKEADGSVIPLFALERSVTIPAHHFMAETLAAEQDWIVARLEQATGEVVQVIATGSTPADAG